MKIVVDSAVPFIQGVLEPFGEVVYKEGSAICPEDIKDADAMIIRTRTRCDAALLDESPVKFIATATIGTDHIDLEYCKQRGIHVQNASGCNAGGVMNYVLSAIYGSASRKRMRLGDAQSASSAWETWVPGYHAPFRYSASKCSNATLPGRRWRARPSSATWTFCSVTPTS